MKFFRWAVERLEGRDGIVCLVTNNSFVHKISFDGMRKNLFQDFTRLYHADLHGNVRDNPKLSGTTHNVFGIQVGVGITIAIRNSGHTNNQLLYHRAPEYWRKEEKLAWLAKKQHVAAVEWKTLCPDDNHTWLVPQHAEEFESYLPLGSKSAKVATQSAAKVVFKVYSAGVKTNSDCYVYDFDRLSLIDRAGKMIDNFNTELDRWKRTGKTRRIEELEKYLRVDETILKWIRNTKRTLMRGNYLSLDKAIYQRECTPPFHTTFLPFRAGLQRRRVSFPIFFPDASNREGELYHLCSREWQPQGLQLLHY